ncbi:uncharacterized protein [Amphiura filiformis]|uniref:uncharacterized protein n=1 Tax=Amphiura filiformis TaxID=82378 RepID=UPI003B218347
MAELCAICHREYREPIRLLTCLHNFCHLCLQDRLCERQEDRHHVILCPLCRAETLIPDGNLYILPSNDALLTRMNQSNERCELVSRCQSCLKQSAIRAKCKTCGHGLCSKCETAHRDMIIFENHRVESVRKCSIHRELPLAFYCGTCSQVMCIQCKVSNHFQRSHHVVALAGSTGDRRKLLKDRIPDLKEAAAKYEQLASRAHAAKFMSEVLIESDDYEFMTLYHKVHAAVEELLQSSRPSEPPHIVLHINGNGEHQNEENGHVHNNDGNGMGNLFDNTNANGYRPEDDIMAGPSNEPEIEPNLENEEHHEHNNDVNGMGNLFDNIYGYRPEDENRMAGPSNEPHIEPKRENEENHHEHNNDVGSLFNSIIHGNVTENNPGPSNEPEIEPKREQMDELMDVDDDGGNVDQQSERSESRPSISTKSDSPVAAGHNPSLWYRIGKIGKKTSRNGNFRNAGGVSVNPTNHDIAVADHTKHRVDVFTQHMLEFKLTIKSKKKKNKSVNYHNAEDVAFNSIGHLFVVDQSKIVQRFSNEGGYLRQFSVLPTDQPRHTKVCSSCIAIDNKDCIYVGDFLRSVVSVFNDSERHIRTVNVSVPPMFLAVNDHMEVLVTRGITRGEKSSRVLTVNMSRTDGPTQKYELENVPYVSGVVWDNRTMGFFVASQEDKRGKGQVHYYSSNGEYVKTVVETKLNNPLGLALSSTGLLVVADLFSVKVFSSEEPENSLSQ